MPHVEETTAKGKLYRYYRRGGQRWGRIQGEPGSEEFNATYKAGEARYEGRRKDTFAPGSFGELTYRYKKSSEYRDRLGDRTRAEYARHLDAMAEKWRDLPISLLRRKHVMAYRDKFIDRPSVGNSRIKVLSVLLSWAVDREILASNVAKGVRKLKEGEYAPWSDADIKAFRESKPAAPVLWAFNLALYTGQRRGDILSMTWKQYDGDAVNVVQEKTGAKVWIPAHPELKAAIEQIPRESVVMLTSANGRAWRGDAFSREFRKATAKAGLENRVFHGLRKTAAVKLAEAGCTEREIRSITGHRTSAMVQHYTKGADQRRLASAAIEKLTGWRNKD